MHAQVEKPKENKIRTVTNSVTLRKSNVKQASGFVDNRPEAIVQNKLLNLSLQANQVTQYKSITGYETIHDEQVKQAMFNPRRELEPNEATSSGYTTGAGAWTEEIYDDDETEVKGTMESFGNSYSFKGTHAETALIEALSDVTSLSGDEIHLVVWISKSPCTSTVRKGFPKTNTSGIGCTERLAELASSGLGGKIFKISIIVHHLYQPRIQGGKNASRAALQYLASLPNVNGVSLEEGQYTTDT